MRVGVTLRVVGNRDYPEIRDAISHEWVPFLQSLGYIPFLIPNTLRDVDAYIRETGIQAMLLTGGNDVSPRLYNGNSDIVANDAWSRERDETEFRLLEFSRRSCIPVVGVCRGMQMMNVFLGGALIQNIRNEIGTQVNHIAHDHHVKIVCSQFERLLGKSSVPVNSFHSQGVTVAKLAKELRSFALSEADGVVEGVFHPKLSWLGMQWHPERKSPSPEIDKIIIEKTFSSHLQDIL